jgi:hypothetical protein
VPVGVELQRRWSHDQDRPALLTVDHNSPHRTRPAKAFMVETPSRLRPIHPPPPEARPRRLVGTSRGAPLGRTPEGHRAGGLLAPGAHFPATV